MPTDLAPHSLELPLSRTYFNGTKGVRVIEVLLYSVLFNNNSFDYRVAQCAKFLTNVAPPDSIVFCFQQDSTSKCTKCSSNTRTLHFSEI